MEIKQQEQFTGFFRGDPHADLARYRDEQPVAPLTLPGGRIGWLVTRYDDVRLALADRRLVKDGLLSPVGYRTPVPAEIFAATARNMLTVDPPDHTRLRRLIQSAFTPRRIEELAGAVTAVADELLDSFATPGPHDVVAEFAFPLPIAVISELVGVAPAERDGFERRRQA
jgi:cytochrome P450